MHHAFLMAIWLHDVGKLATPLEVMDKESRLGSRLKDVKERLRTIGLLDSIAHPEGRIDQETLTQRDRERTDAWACIERINRAGFLPDEDLKTVADLADIPVLFEESRAWERAWDGKRPR